jgi:hypothetical protein
MIVLGYDMRFIGLFILFLLVGCETGSQHIRYYPRTPPMIDQFWYVKGEPYIEHLYDCSNKSSKYCRILRENGYDANIIVTKVGEGKHAVVEVKFGDNDFLFCDPTQGKWDTKLDPFGTVLHRIPFDERLDKSKWKYEFIETF